MSLARTYSRAQIGLDSPLVCVEVHLGSGLPAFSIVGLPAPVVRESTQRVRSALVNSGFEFPAGRITVNLAPADLRKVGGRFDLPIALCVLRASGQLAHDDAATEYYGELGLEGDLKPVAGLLPAALAASRAGRRVVLPRVNLDEARLAGCHDARAADSLAELCLALRSPPESHALVLPPVGEGCSLRLADVRGQRQAKRALAIAAAGGHSLLLIGSPGTGKTMLAQRLPALLPPLDHEAALQVAAIASLGLRGFDPRCWGQRPFRSPHHTASAHALVGGGRDARPGEVTLAHHGVLFLDELPEFDRHVLEALREPLESGVISVARAAVRVEYPARFQLVAAMNPCPCGYLGERAGRCRCSGAKVQRYRQRISGPLLERIDMQVELTRVEPQSLRCADAPERSDELPARIARAHAAQQSRQGCSNAQLEGAALAQFCALNGAALAVLERAMRNFGLSARAYHRVLRVARTIADLESERELRMPHIGEALMLRQMEAVPAAEVSTAPLPGAPPVTQRVDYRD
ncbi:MAG: YifB family Mg chelatase-like AAA ATPase [Steroidobacteraceae bacterium]